MYSLEQIRAAIAALETVDGNTALVLEQIDRAVVTLKMSLDEMDGLAVKGRKTVDTLLGCMMAVDEIIGEGENNG